MIPGAASPLAYGGFHDSQYCRNGPCGYGQDHPYRADACGTAGPSVRWAVWMRAPPIRTAWRWSAGGHLGACRLRAHALRDTEINLIDTPGHTDFSAEVERSLWALDGAVLLISAVEGVLPQTEKLFQTLRKLRLPVGHFSQQDRPGGRGCRRRAPAGPGAAARRGNGLHPRGADGAHRGTG